MSGYSPQQTTASTSVDTTAPRMWEKNSFMSLGQVKRSDNQIDQFDSDKWNDETAEAIDQQVALQNGERAHWLVSNAAQRQRDQRDDDQRVKNDGAENRTGRTVQVHDVQRRDLGKPSHQHRRYDCEVFRDVVCDAERSERTARDQHLFPDLDDVEQLGRITVEIDHVAGFAGGLRAGVHGNAHV